MTEHCSGFWQLPAECDISNLATATIEIFIAIGLASIAIIIATVFYRKEQSARKEPDEIILKQGEKNQKEEEKEQIMINDLKKKLGFNLQRTKLVLQEIDKILQQETSAIPFLPKRELFLETFDSCIKEMNKATTKLFSLEIRIPDEVSEAQGKIFVFSRDFEKALDEGRGFIETPPDPTEVIAQIDVALKDLPEPGLA